MNWQTAVPLLVAAITVAGSIYGAKRNASTTNEGIYASHVGELLDKVDKYMTEREMYLHEITKLKEQVYQANKRIEELEEKINGLDQGIKSGHGGGASN
ncbi:hypothetical protein [Schleiferilactobacillus perolens]|uniref:Uncharacterized protein n=1 Tax=Schleiferilactobacillus perolens DSM 12744 TaxID=1423792 RepID=A0A0R1MRF0_9LACO|nr:hypothetical protein [Schleiferilactobacillus perolens]KRL06987.1 hypothetical protein FD09_GL002060 [Schleiferilactobacillus perolens DSM 12744]